MKNYKISITPSTYILCSNGYTSGTYDVQFVFDEYGFPYFPAKTFKGLLRESMIEVLEMSGKNKSEIERIITKFFGIGGNDKKESLLKLNNFYLPDYHKQLESIKNKADRNKVSNYFIAKVQQTALNETDKTDDKENIIAYQDIAKEGSLRTLAVLDFEKVKSFETELCLENEIIDEEYKYLERAIKHLRNIGISRNRGLGKCKCKIEKVLESQVEENNANESNYSKDELTDFDFLQIKITSNEPLVLGTQNADQNTVYSQDFISGSQIWGALAWKFGDFKSPDFKDIFLSNQIKFDFCFPENSFPVPNSIHRDKYIEEKVAPKYNILNNAPENTVTKSIGGMINEKGKVKIKKSFNFHSSRPNRNAGRSTENEGSIFYYESINKGTQFVGKIIGKKDKLAKLYKKIGAKTTLNFGRSKSTQYGQVLVELSKVKSTTTNPSDNLKKDTYFMVAQTPIVLFNEVGFPSPTRNDLAVALQIEKEKIETATISYIAIEHFNGVWESKTGKWNAYEKGSTFKINDFLPQVNEAYIGEMNDKGFGKVKFYTQSEMLALIELLKDIEDSKSPIESSLLKNIEDNLAKKSSESNIKSMAYEDAKSGKWKDLTNSLISRMLSMIGAFDESDERFEEFIKTKFKEIETQQAGKTLKNVHLLDDLLSLKLTQKVTNKETKVTEEITKYDGKLQYKIYWIAFFQALRKINKKK